MPSGEEKNRTSSSTSWPPWQEPHPGKSKLPAVEGEALRAFGEEQRKKVINIPQPDYGWVINVEKIKPPALRGVRLYRNDEIFIFKLKLGR